MSDVRIMVDGEELCTAIRRYVEQVYRLPTEWARIEVLLGGKPPPRRKSIHVQAIVGVPARDGSDDAVRVAFVRDRHGDERPRLQGCVSTDSAAVDVGPDSQEPTICDEYYGREKFPR